MKIHRLLRRVLPLLFVAATTSMGQAFVHPGISHSQADLDRMKNNLNVEPYKTMYAAFSSSGYSQSTNTGQGPFTYETYGHGQFEIRNDAQVAHQNAVMWYVTGNPAYRDNAIHIMMMWANTLTSFDVTDHLTAGTALYDFCNAGEIIRTFGNGAWSATDIATFQNWLVTYLYPPLLTPGNSIAANVLEAGGHGGLQIKGLLSLGIFCERSDIYNFGVNSVLHNGNYTYGLLEYIDASGQNYENQRDVGHPSGNLGSFVESFYMIYNQGQDLFSYANNLLASAFESQAKFDLGWDVVPFVWTARDGGVHSKMSGDYRTAYDNLESDQAYHIYHDLKGLNMPYTKMSADLKFPYGGSLGGSFYNRVDSSGQVPVAPLVGEPAETGVGLYEDYLSGSYITNFQPGNYTNAALRAGGMQANGSGPTSSMRIPIGWTATLYSADNFTGNTLTVSGTMQNLGIIDLVALNFNDELTSMKVTGGGIWPIFNTTYQIVNLNSGQLADVPGASTADGDPVVQKPQAGSLDQYWRVEGLGHGQYKIVNLNGNRAMEVSGASLTGGAPIDQRAYVPWPALAQGGTASASSENASNGEGSAQAFDGTAATKWNTTVNGPTGWLQYRFASGTRWAVDQYVLTSANDVPQRDPADWQLQGSNDGSTWTTLDTQTGQVFANRFQANTYNITNLTSYAYYRLNVTANNGGSGYSIQLSELGLYASTTGGVHQRWTFGAVPASGYSNTVSITNVNSGLLADVSGASPNDGAALVQQAGNGAADQQWSLQVPVSTPAPIGPGFISGPTSGVGNGVAYLNWNSPGNSTGYTVARSTVSGSPYTVVNANVPGLSYVDTGLTNGTTYYYTVTPFNNSFMGSTSAPISTTPSASTTLLRRSTGGVSSSSSGNPPSESDAQAFDQSSATKWYAPTAPPGWLQYQFGNNSAWAVTQYQITSASDVKQRDPSSWQLLGSNDGAAWAILDTRTGQSFATRSLTKTYTVANTNPYRYYRLGVSANNGGAAYGIQLAELALQSPPTDPGDKTPPLLTVPANLTTQATGAAGAVVNYAVTATDVVSGALGALCTPASGSTFPIGTSTVTCGATDLAGNTISKTFSVLVQQSYRSFIQRYFLPGDWANLARTGMGVDFDGDGLSNLLEYFMGTDPTSTDVAASSMTDDGNGNAILTFRMEKNLSGVSVAIQKSSDLTTWSGTGVIPQVLTDQGSYYLMKATVPKNGAPMMFLRVSVSSP